MRVRNCQGLPLEPTGYTATDLNHQRGHQTVEEGAAEPVRLALLPQDGPTGGFFQADRGSPLVN
jgi:hypothetical protein